MSNPRKTRRPLKADYRNLSRYDVAALVNAYGEIRDLQRLRMTSNFYHMTCIIPIGFDLIDQRDALRFIIDEVNVAAPEDEDMARLAKRLKRSLGALDKPIALNLQGNGFIIEPDVWLQEVYRIELAHAAVIEMVNGFGKVRNLEDLRNVKQLRHLSFVDPVAFAPDEQKYALTYIIDAVNAARDDKAMVKLGQYLKRHLGVLNLPISVSLQGYNAVIQPQVCLH